VWLCRSRTCGVCQLRVPRTSQSHRLAPGAWSRGGRKRDREVDTDVMTLLQQCRILAVLHSLTSTSQISRRCRRCGLSRRTTAMRPGTSAYNLHSVTRELTVTRPGHMWSRAILECVAGALSSGSERLRYAQRWV
jgi:hypothetical protein